MKILYKVLLGISLICLFAVLLLVVLGSGPSVIAPFVITMFV